MSSTNALYGDDAGQRITAIEPVTSASVRLYRRTSDGLVIEEDLAVRPWLVTTRSGLDLCRGDTSRERLFGDLPLNFLVHFSDWNKARGSSNAIRNAGVPQYNRVTLAEQFMMSTGITLFKEMEYDDLLRLQIDLETAGLNPRDPDSRILIIAVRTNRGVERILELDSNGEADLIQRATDLLVEIDPDIIEGHNLFRFDLPFIMIRARDCGVRLQWGRDGSALRLEGNERLRAGARSIPFPNIRLYGRHLLDTYHQVQRYDTAGEFQSYGLKQSIAFLGLERSDREFVSGKDVFEIWEHERETLRRYALDDVRDVGAISDLTALTDFYQTQMVPRSYQDIATGGTGEKINLLMVRAYLAERYSLPLANPPSEISGGLTELRHSGVFRPTVKCDVESLYPAIMLTDQISPETDHLGIYITMLRELTDRRLTAKRQFQQSTGAERHRWNGLQSSFKVLINSFYGYLGYSGGIFNDFEAAERVTQRGQALIRQVADELERRGAIPIEIDTDGVYFQPPESIVGESDEIAFVEQIGETLPDGISLAHDGSYAGMVSLRTKNYALVTRQNQVILKGSSLRSRRDEPILRRFLTEAVLGFVNSDINSVRDHYFATAQRIVDREFSAEEISRTESITEKTFTSQANRRLAKVAENLPQGERVQVYERSDGSLALINDFKDDPNIDYLLRRLRDTAGRFQPLFATSAEFDHTFPRVNSTSDLEALAVAPPVEQLGMFPE